MPVPRSLQYLLACLLIALAASAGAAERKALVGGTLVDGLGGEPIRDSVILVEGDTIQAATYWPSKFMGVEDQWGTLVPGRYADIIAIEGDALRYINLLQDVDFVMKAGVVYKRDGEPVEDLVR